MVANPLAAWHDFYTLLGAGAATLIGAMFVVASLASRFLASKRGDLSRMFITPTVTHLSSVLFACALVMAPVPMGLRSAVFGLGGLAGMGYGAFVAARIGKRLDNHGDRLWYAAGPVLGYGVMLAAGLTLEMGSSAGIDVAPVGVDLLAVSLALLLLADVRNAWDIILFFVAHPGGVK
jgi:hypothetical protein